MNDYLATSHERVTILSGCSDTAYQQANLEPDDFTCGLQSGLIAA